MAGSINAGAVTVDGLFLTGTFGAMAVDLEPPGPVLSVVIPAHNEAAVIERCLRTLLADAEEGEFDVWVVANGCSDDTARRAESYPVHVIDRPSPGKPGALQAGDAASTVFPRIYLDADIELTSSAARAVAVVLRAGPTRLAAPRPEFDLLGCSKAVAAFYRTWQRLPWLRHDPVGNGVFALSKQGRDAFADWPAIIADDLFVSQLFSDHQRRCLAEQTFTIHPPRSLKALLAVRRRVALGNDELDRLRAAGSLPPVASSSLQTGQVLLRLLRQPGRLSVLVYVFVVVTGRASAVVARRRGAVGWDRDDTSRA